MAYPFTYPAIGSTESFIGNTAGFFLAAGILLAPRAVPSAALVALTVGLATVTGGAGVMDEVRLVRGLLESLVVVLVILFVVVGLTLLPKSALAPVLALAALLILTLIYMIIIKKYMLI